MHESHYAVQQKLTPHCKSTVLQFKKSLNKRDCEYQILKNHLIIWNNNSS